jgi:hypothetical protein
MGVWGARSAPPLPVTRPESVQGRAPTPSFFRESARKKHWSVASRNVALAHIMMAGWMRMEGRHFRAHANVSGFTVRLAALAMGFVCFAVFCLLGCPPCRGTL